MKFSMETYTPLIKNLQTLNQEIRQRHSSMPSCTEQEMKNLVAWSEEVQQMVRELDNISLIISLHLSLLETEYKELQQKTISKD